MAALTAPAPVLPPANYLQIPAIYNEIMDMNNNSTEDHMYGIWDAILNWHFPYDAAGQRSFFLITQCKRFELRTREAEWLAAAEQLRDYLNLQHQTRPTHQVYGIVAIGDRVRFFKYNYRKQNLTPWRPPATGISPLPGSVGKRDWYDLKVEAPKVQEALQVILTNH